jgi:hypothetical protein
MFWKVESRSGQRSSQSATLFLLLRLLWCIGTVIYQVPVDTVDTVDLLLKHVPGTVFCVPYCHDMKNTCISF